MRQNPYLEPFLAADRGRRASEESSVFRSSQELTAELKKGYKCRSWPLIHGLLRKKPPPLRGVAERAVVAHICQELLLEHKNLAADMPWMQVTAID